MAGQHRSPRLSLRILAAAAAIACTAGLATAASAVASPPNPPPSKSKAYPGSVPPWAGSRTKTGNPLSNTTVEGEIYFSLRDLAGAKATADGVSTPGSVAYGQYLTPQQWIDTYAPTQAAFDATVSWLKSQGMTVTGTPQSRLYVVFRGTVAQINAAFSTSEQNYSFGGQTLIGPATAPSVPADLGSAIQGVSIDQGRLLTHPTNATPDSGEAAPAASKPIQPPLSVPCSDYWAQKTATLPEAYGTTSFPTYICGYTLVYAGSLPGPFRFGAGGGTSAVFAQPAYQAGTVPASLAQGHRVSPDVSSLADPYTGYRIGFSPITNDNVLKTGSFAFEGIGGTSLACPLTAAQMAVAQAASGKVIGFANPTIYAAAASGGAQRDVAPPSQEKAVAFSSTVSGNTYLVGMNHDSSLFTATGYDDVTGVGSMTEAFAQQVAALH